MLAKKYRLPIQSVFGKSGRSFKSRCFLFKIFPNSADFNRFGAVISKKVAKRAAERNRLKRIVFDSVKRFVRQPADAEDKNKFDILIIFLPDVAKLKKADIIKEINESLREIVKS